MRRQQYNVFMRVEVGFLGPASLLDLESIHLPVCVGPGCAESNRQDRPGGRDGQTAGDEEQHVNPAMS